MRLESQLEFKVNYNQLLTKKYNYLKEESNS